MLKRAFKEEGMQDVTASLAGIDAAVTAELDGIFSLKEEQRATLKAFLSEPRVFATLQCDATHYREVTCLMFLFAPTGSRSYLLVDLSPLNVIETRFIQSPFKFCLPLPKAFGTLSIRWIHEMNSQLFEIHPGCQVII